MSKVTEFDYDFIIANQRSEMPLLYIDDDIKQKLTIPVTKRMSNPQGNNLIENIINQNIKNNQNIPLVMRKRLMCEKRLKQEQEQENFIKQLEIYVTVPISLRKHLLYKEARAS